MNPVVRRTKSSAFAFTYEELDLLVAGAKEEPEWQAAILVAGDAGLRLGEILALQWEDVDFKTGTLTVMRVQAEYFPDTRSSG